jgi:hypothetical protein
MNHTGIKASKSIPRLNNRGSSQFALREQLGDTVRELYELLELYAPVWYTQELHDKSEAALQALNTAGNFTDSARPR